MNNNSAGSRRSFRGIRKFFSDRSSRSSQSSKSSKSTDTNLPSLSPQPPPLTSTPPNLDSGDHLSSPESLKSRTRSLRNSAKRKLISVETNLRVVTGRSRCESPGSCVSSGSSSCGSGLWNAEKLDLTEDGTASVSTTNSKNVDEPVKQTETVQRPIDETCDSKESPQTPLEESSVPESEVKHVVMFTNPFDLK